MNNQWEIEWNSSQLRYGHDMGTVDFMLTKGADLRDLNYVLFDVHDESYEPLIKAVALRDNSHSDIIRKIHSNILRESANLILKQEPQQPDLFGMPSPQFQPAVPAAGTAVAPNPRAAKQANRAQRAGLAGQRVVGAEAEGNRAKMGDYAQAGYYGQAAQQGVRNTFGALAGAAKGAGEGAWNAGGAAKNWLMQDKQPGVKSRLGGFMQGVGDTVRHGKQAWQAGREDNRQRREGAARRSFLEGQAGNMGREEQRSRERYTPHGRGDSLAEGQLSDSMAGINERYGQSSGVSPAEGEDTMGAMQSEIEGIGRDQAKPKQGLGARIRALGNARRMGATNEGEAANEIAVREAQVEGELNANPEANEAAGADASPTPPEEGQSPIAAPVEQPTEEAPPAPAVNPEPAEPSLGMRSIKTGGMQPGGRAGKRVAGAIDNHEWGEEGSGNFEDHYNTLSQAAATDTGKVSTKAKASVIAALTQQGYQPQQAEQIVEAANEGDQEAVQIVEEAQSPIAAPVDPKSKGIEQGNITLMSEDKHIPDWNMLMKNLNIR